MAILDGDGDGDGDGTGRGPVVAPAGPAAHPARQPAAGTGAAVDRTGLAGDYFDVMARYAREHWWYRARAAWMTEAIGQAGAPRGRVLDVGCGTGAALERLGAAGFRATIGTDLSPVALGHARAAVGTTLCQSRAEQLPFATGTVACLVSMDVIEHLDDDLAALREYVRVVAPGGLVLLTVPAYQWLFAAHDVRAGHRRRYGAAGLRAVAGAAGIEVERVTYFNSFLVPPAALVRRTPLRRLSRRTDEEASDVHPALGALFDRAAAAERWLARRVPIPVGLSILLVGRVRS